MKIGNLEIERDFLFVTVKPLVSIMADKRLIVNCLVSLYLKRHGDKKTRMQLRIDTSQYRLALMHDDNLINAVSGLKNNDLVTLFANFRHQYLKSQKKVLLRDFGSAKVELKKVNIEELYIQTNISNENE